MKPICLLACSNKKAPGVARAAAHALYAGTLFRLGYKWALLNGYTPMIVSAKYGLIHADDVIDTYDQVLKKPFPTASYPEGHGVYIGGQRYFALAPERFKPLLTPNSIGYMLQQLKRLVEASSKS